MSESVDLEALREEARRLRDRADAIDRHADAIDTHMRALAELSFGSQPGRQKVVLPPSSAPAPRSLKKGGKGKPPGTMSMKWRGYFADICTNRGSKFELANVVAVVQESENRTMRPTEVRRLFKVHVQHGYLVALDENTYEMTDKLVQLVDEYVKSEGPPVVAEGPYSGGVAERLNASDSKSDGAGLDSAPVGSNPTASVPSPVNLTHTDMWDSLSPTNQPND